MAAAFSGHRGPRPSWHRWLSPVCLEAASRIYRGSACGKADITLDALCRRLVTELEVKADTSMLSRFFRREGISLKKDAGGTAAGPTGCKPPPRPMAPLSGPYRSGTAGLHRRNMDEDQYDAPHGWAARGWRLAAKVPHGHWKTTTFLAALRNDRIEAPARSMDGSTAGAFGPMSSDSSFPPSSGQHRRD
jgi:hypothetical protein